MSQSSPLEVNVERHVQYLNWPPACLPARLLRHLSVGDCDCGATGTGRTGAGAGAGSVAEAGHGLLAPVANRQRRSNVRERERETTGHKVLAASRRRVCRKRSSQNTGFKRVKLPQLGWQPQPKPQLLLLHFGCQPKSQAKPATGAQNSILISISTLGELCAAHAGAAKSKQHPSRQIAN